MKLNSKNKLMLGLFIVIGLAILTYLIFYIGQNKNLFTPTISLRSIFKNVNGLQVGNNVRFSGIKVGTVSNIQILNDTSILVETYIDTRYQNYIRKDSRMAIGAEGLMGDKLIDVTPGHITSENVKNNDYLESVKPMDVDGMIKTAQNTLANVEGLSNELKQIAHKVNQSKGLFYTLMSDKESGMRFKNTMKNLETSTALLADNLEAAKHSFLFRRYFKKKEKAEREKQGQDNEDDNDSEEKPDEKSSKKDKKKDKKK